MKTLCFCAFALIGLHACAVYLLPDLATGSWHFLTRTWGFDFLTFYPSSVAVCAYAVAVAVAVPHINLTAANGVERVVGFVKINKAFLWCGLCIGFGVVFILFKQKYPLLGDGPLRPLETAAGEYYKNSVGISFVLLFLQQWVGQWDDQGILAFRVFSVFWGLPYVVLACAWSDLVGRRRFEKVFCFLLMVLIGSLQYFFGYIEMYAPLPAVVLAFVLFGVSGLRQNKLPVWSTICFVVGVVLHVLLLFLAPALLFLWWLSLSRKYPVLRDRKAVAVGVVVCVAVACVLASAKADVLLTPRRIFTLSHMWEFLNSQILSAPVALPVLLLCLFAVHRFGRETTFLFLCVVAVLFSLFVVDAGLGSIDWDIFALSGVPLMALATHTLGQVKNRHVKKYSFLFSCVCAGLLIVPFVSINYGDQSVDRFIEITENDPAPYYANYATDLNLALYFDFAGLDSLASVYYERAYKRNPHEKKIPFNRGMSLFRNDKYVASIPYFLSALQLSPDYEYERALEALIWLVLHYPGPFIESVDKHFPKSKHNSLWIRLAFFGLETGKIQLVHDMSPEVTHAVVERANFYLSQQDSNRAAYLLRHALLGNVEMK